LAPGSFGEKTQDWFPKVFENLVTPLCPSHVSWSNKTKVVC